MRLNGKTAIVTGGARGMGAATCRLFASEGAKVAIADILDDDGLELARELGAGSRFYHLDVGDPDQWREVVAQAEAELGPVDILVNNAGILLLRELLETSIDDFRKVIQVNLEGPFLGIQAVAPGMIERGRGSIVNVSSLQGIRAMNAAAAYCASKFGVRGLTRVAALELGHRGVRVNSIHPGAIDTPLANPGNIPREQLDKMFVNCPAQRMGLAEEVANATLFLASDEASYVIGAELIIDGGSASGIYQPGIGGEPASLKFGVG